MTHWNPHAPPEDGLPPKEIRLIELHAEPWLNHANRLRIHLEITPFLERPSLQVTLTDQDGHEAASIHIIETIESRMTFTMHLRGEVEAGPLQLKAILFYPETGIVDEKSEIFQWTGIDSPST